MSWYIEDLHDITDNSEYSNDSESSNDWETSDECEYTSTDVHSNPIQYGVELLGPALCEKSKESVMFQFQVKYSKKRLYIPRYHYEMFMFILYFCVFFPLCFCYLFIMSASAN